MITKFIIQKRHPHLGEEFKRFKDWHDRSRSRKDLSLPLAIKEAQMLQSNYERCEYRVVKRIDETIFTASKQISKNI